MLQVQIKVVREDVEVAVLPHKSAVDAAIVRVADAVELRGVGHRQRAQQDSLHQREDGRVGPDAESQRDHGRQRESRRFAQLSQGITKVLGKCIQFLRLLFCT